MVVEWKSSEPFSCKILVCIELFYMFCSFPIWWVILHVLCKIQVGSFDAGFGASIMSRLVRFETFKDLRWSPHSLLQFWVVDWIGWAKTSTWNVVYGEVLQRLRGRENGTCQYCCSCKNIIPCYWNNTRAVSLTNFDNSKNFFLQVEKLEEETVKWCREILRNSPMAVRLCKSAINAADDGHVGLQVPPNLTLFRLLRIQTIHKLYISSLFWCM